MPTTTLMAAAPLTRYSAPLGANLVVDDRPGTILLRHNGVLPYDERILVSNWQEAALGYPKDLDANFPDLINKRAANYRRWGMEDQVCPISECRDRMSDVGRKGEFTEKQTRLPMITAENFFRLVSLERPMSLEGRQPLPRHSKDHNKGRYNTTYCVDYLAPYSYQPKAPNPIDIDWSPAVRRMKSQFTDVADYRRNGRNTWLDESGIYANQDAKRKFFPVRNPTLEFLKPYVEERPKTQGSRSIFKPEGGDVPLDPKKVEKHVNFSDEGCTDPWPKT